MQRPSDMDLDRVRCELLARRQGLVHRFLDLEADIEALQDEREIEPADAARVEMSEEILSRLDEQDRRELDEIEAALGRLASGTYGLCDDCGAAISEARLRALPTARLCIACAVETEAAAKTPS